MTLPVVHLHRIAPEPWANGGGSTRVLLAWPPGKPWVLRVSVAEVQRDGPFSPWPGLQRWIAVVQGAGMVLAGGAGRQILQAQPLCFDGADAPHAELLDGACTDLNLMLRQGAGTGGMLRALPDTEWLHPAPWRALYAADALTLQVEDTDVAALPAGSLVHSDHAARQRWRVRPQDPLAARGWWLHFQPGVAP